MTPQELDQDVSKVADTPGTKIGIAEVARVRSCIFRELVKLPAAECSETISNCLRSAEAKLHDDAVSG